MFNTTGEKEFSTTSWKALASFLVGMAVAVLQVASTSCLNTIVLLLPGTGMNINPSSVAMLSKG